MSYFWCHQPIRVRCQADGVPRALRWRCRTHRVIRIDNHWRVAEGWWKGAERIERDFWKLVTDSGLLLVIYHDRCRGGWFMHQECD